MKKAEAGENCRVTSFVICRLFFTRCHYDDQNHGKQMGRVFSGHGAVINLYKILVREPEGYRLKRSGRRWKDNIEIDIKEI
jgi:hypothetical protein